MTDTDKNISKSAWDLNPDDLGLKYGKTTYQQVNPDDVNPDDYAQSLHEGEEHFGDVREYNSALNDKAEGNDATLNDLSRPGTEFKTEAEKYKGDWQVVGLPRSVTPHIVIVAKRLESDEEVEIPALDLGVVASYEDNLYRQVVTSITKKVKVNSKTRARLTGDRKG